MIFARKVRKYIVTTQINKTMKVECWPVMAYNRREAELIIHNWRPYLQIIAVRKARKGE